MQPRTTPRAIPIQGRRRIGRYVLSAVGLAALALAYFTVPQWWNKRARTKWKAALHAREDKQAEFGRWLDVGTCTRRASDDDPQLAARCRTVGTDGVDLKAARDKLRAVQAAHAAARDYIWWRLELGFGLEDLLDRAYAAHASGGDVAAAIRAPLGTLKHQIAAAEAAYVGIARVPELDELARAKPDMLWDVVRRVPDNGEWSDLAHDNMVYGPMPPEPEGCNVSDEEQ